MKKGGADTVGDNVAIVALPIQESFVYKLSSEQIPHLTILSLGSGVASGTITKVREYLRHAVDTSLLRFYLDIEARGVLGDKEADVLFFTNQSAENIAKFRYQLLNFDPIKKLTLTSEQFPKWVPHLTLGFPESPANENYQGPRLQYVAFDRIALWDGNYEGDEFKIPSEELSMGETVASNVLEHYGVKGMHWGVRRAQRKAARADAKWEKNIYTSSGAMKIHNATARSMNKVLNDFNASPKYKGMDLVNEPNSPASKRYTRDYEKLLEEHTRQAIAEVHGSNPSGSRKAILDTSGEEWSIKVVDTKVKHADIETVPDLIFGLLHDEKGFITKVVERKSEAMHSGEIEADTILEHYGIKGMRWGVRKKSGASVTPSSDAMQAKAYRARAKKNPDALSNQELQALVTRMNLEQQYARLRPATRGEKATKFATELLVNVGKQQAQKLAQDQAAKQIAKMLARR